MTPLAPSALSEVVIPAGSRLSPGGIQAERPVAGTGASIDEAARQFEGLLLTELMKSMRKTVPESPFFSSLSNDTFTAMLDEEVAKQMAMSQSLGIADMLAQQLGEDGALDGLMRDGSWVQPLADMPAPRLHEGQRFGAARPDHMHQGIDLAQVEGASVLAANAGIVRAIGRDADSRGGLSVTLEHQVAGQAIQTRYFHLSDIRTDLKVGDAVKAGDRVGSVGATGTSAEGAHLHFEIVLQENDKKTHVDPEAYVYQWVTPKEKAKVGANSVDVGRWRQGTQP